DVRRAGTGQHTEPVDGDRRGGSADFRGVDLHRPADCGSPADAALRLQLARASARVVGWAEGSRADYSGDLSDDLRGAERFVAVRRRVFRGAGVGDLAGLASALAGESPWAAGHQSS